MPKIRSAQVRCTPAYWEYFLFQYNKGASDAHAGHQSFISIITHDQLSPPDYVAIEYAERQIGQFVRASLAASISSRWILHGNVFNISQKFWIFPSRNPHTITRFSLTKIPAMARQCLIASLILLSLLFCTLSRAQGTCSSTQECVSGCCNENGFCGFGPTYCGAGNCTSTCNAQAECGRKHLALLPRDLITT